MKKRNLFFGFATYRDDEQTLKDVLECGFFGDKRGEFFKDVKENDIGFLLVSYKGNDKVKRKKVILGPFEAKGGVFNAKNKKPDKSPEWVENFPWIIEVKHIIKNFITKPDIYIVKNLKGIFTHNSDAILQYEYEKGERILIALSDWIYLSGSALSYDKEVVDDLLERFIDIVEKVDKSSADPLYEVYLNLSEETETEIEWDNIVGLDDLKKDFDRVIKIIKERREQAKEMELPLKFGYLLFGPPGTGKTMIAEAVAKKVEARLYRIEPEFIMGYPGEAEKKLERLFNNLMKQDKAVLFIDEAEWILSKRETEYSSVMARVKPKLLMKISESFKKNPSNALIIIASTNLPEKIDPAFTRSGRFDRVFYLPPLTDSHIKEMLKKHIKDDELVEKIFGKLKDKAGNDKFFTGADIESLIRRAKEMAIFEGSQSIEFKHVNEALQNLRPTVTAETINKYEKYIKVFSAIKSH